MYFGQHIREYRDEILKFLAEMVAIPSVADGASQLPDKPYGEAAAQALGHILAKAKELGLSVKNVGNYAGHAAYDCGKEGYAAVLDHVDVVPAGTGWDTDPYVMTEQDGLLFGRGVLDNKGPAVVALFCLKALQDYGVTGNRSIRCIFGSGEEIGMEDLTHYFKEEPLPDLSFTPDGNYGICNREKGIIHMIFRGSNDSSLIRSFHAGEVCNAVPEVAEAVVACTAVEAETLSAAAKAAGEPCTVTFDEETGMAALTMQGKAAHAREPENGRNAAMHLLLLLARVFGKERLGSLPSFLVDAAGLETDGRRFGVEQSDSLSGPLTLNVGIVQVDGTDWMAGIDIRYPVTADGDGIIRQIRERVEAAGFTYETLSHPRPLYASEDSQLVTVLSNAYRTVMGEAPDLFSTGGGSYARCIPGRCVAFGPVFRVEPDRRIHQSGEHVDIELFFRHGEICLEAMYQMIMAE